MRKSCKECPWKVNSNHNRNFRKSVDKMYTSGIIKSKQHTCHMISNVWDNPTPNRVCIGSLG